MIRLLIGLFGITLSLAAGAKAEQEIISLPFNTDCPECVAVHVVPAGTFEMGGYIDYGYGETDGPAHTVHIAKPFAVAEHEVTVAQFRRFAEATGYVSAGKCFVYSETTTWYISPKASWDNPGFPQEETHPVVCVSWDDIQAYIAWLNGVTGNSYRMTSEAEWEYIASTGGLGSGPDGAFTHEDGNIGQVACCGGAVLGRDTWLYTAPPGSFSADKYGLYDIRGNVWELQADCYQKDYVGAPADGSARTQCEEDGHRVVRGSSYGDAGDYLSPRYRLPGKRPNGYFTVGFRLAHSLGD